MASESAKSFAKCSRGLIVAPAGCGKTHLIAQSVRCDRDRQLILTHTHAGVRAIRDRLKEVGVGRSHATVTTIDSLALRYAAAYPGISGILTKNPNKDEWDRVHSSAAKVFDLRAVKKVLKTTYNGIYVDEYQDCSADQHRLIMLLAKLLPCRIVGDPMQAIFRMMHKDNVLPWVTVERDIPKIDQLDTPHRWLGRNDDLGHWLLDVRKRLEAGVEIDLSYPQNRRKDAGYKDQVGVCKKTLNYKDQTVVGLLKWPQQCADLARKLRNTFVVMEAVNLDDLHNYCKKIENATGQARLNCIAEFANKCLSGLSKDIKDYPKNIAAGSPPNPRKEDRKLLLKYMKLVTANNDLKPVSQLLNAYNSLAPSPIFKRRELWSELRRAIDLYNPTSGKSLSDTSHKLRQYARRVGRSVPPRCISTPLLVKGLEFDHAIVLDMDAFAQDSPELAYVAMTRGSRSLTVLSSENRIKFAKPAYILGC